MRTCPALEQRYRYYPNAGFLEMVSPAEEARLIAQGCTRELWRTIKPEALGGTPVMLSPKKIAP